MRNWRRGLIIASASVVGFAIFLLSAIPTAGQAPTPYKAPRTADGKPDLNGIWQALNTANWNIQDQIGRAHV